MVSLVVDSRVRVPLGSISAGVADALRAAYELWRSPIPEGLVVLHECDNPPCVRPEHLRAGTQADNVADRVAKNRSYRGPHPWFVVDNRGERNGQSKLTNVAVEEIRRRSAKGETGASLARAFEVSKPTISMILTGMLWAQ
jgi:hypothetical protein